VRVLVLTADYGPNVWSGIGTAVSHQAAALAARGHHVDVGSSSARPDVVHLHSLALARVAMRSQLPFLYTAHSLVETELAGTTAGTEHWIRFQRRVFECADHVCFVSRSERGRALQQMPALAPRSSVLHNGLPSVEVRGGRRHGPIVFAGRFTHTKGTDVVARIAIELLRRTNSMQFIFAGGHGDDVETALLRDVAAQFPRRCQLPGWLPRPELQSLLAGASLVVIPSRYEPFGMVALEAMQMGVPVLACATGGLVEIVQPGAGGRLIHSLVAKKWADACLELLEDEPAWTRLSRRGPAWVSSQFDVNLTAARLEAILTEIATCSRISSHEFRNN